MVGKWLVCLGWTEDGKEMKCGIVSFVMNCTRYGKNTTRPRLCWNGYKVIIDTSAFFVQNNLFSLFVPCKD